MDMDIGEYICMTKEEFSCRLHEGLKNTIIRMRSAGIKPSKDEIAAMATFFALIQATVEEEFFKEGGDN